MQQQHDNGARSANQDGFYALNSQDGFFPSLLAYGLMRVEATFYFASGDHYRGSCASSVATRSAPR